MSDLLPANVTLLQPGSRYFMLQQALQTLDIAGQVNSQITDLQTQVTALQGYVAALQTAVSTLQSQMTTVQGQISTLEGQVSTLQAQATTFTAFIASFNYQQAEVSTGSIYLDQRTIYRRSFVISNALNTALTVFTFAHGVANINYIAGVQAMASQATGQQLPITFVNLATSPNITIGLSCWCDTTNIYISVGATTFPGYLTLVTLWYTATDR